MWCLIEIALNRGIDRLTWCCLIRLMIVFLVPIVNGYSMTKNQLSYIIDSNINGLHFARIVNPASSFFQVYMNCALRLAIG